MGFLLRRGTVGLGVLQAQDDVPAHDAGPLDGVIEVVNDILAHEELEGGADGNLRLGALHGLDRPGGHHSGHGGVWVVVECRVRASRSLRRGRVRVSAASLGLAARQAAAS